MLLSYHLITAFLVPHPLHDYIFLTPAASINVERKKIPLTQNILYLAKILSLIYAVPAYAPICVGVKSCLLLPFLLICMYTEPNVS